MEKHNIQTCLIVDDEKELRSILKDIIGDIDKFSVKVIEAIDGIDALEKIKYIKSPFILLTDYDMPKLNGIDLILKSIELDRNIPNAVFLISGAFDDKEKLSEIKSLLNKSKVHFNFFQKPFPTKEISNAIQYVVDN